MHSFFRIINRRSIKSDAKKSCSIQNDDLIKAEKKSIQSNDQRIDSQEEDESSYPSLLDSGYEADGDEIDLSLRVSQSSI